jgi:hypothetical protein
MKVTPNQSQLECMVTVGEVYPRGKIMEELAATE